MIDRGQAAKEGRRMYAFYQGFKARRKGEKTNPYPPESEQAQCWEAGRRYAEGISSES